MESSDMSLHNITKSCLDFGSVSTVKDSWHYLALVLKVFDEQFIGI